ncbi:CHAP domain-containing protein [Ktedonobacter racemifer]|uniref:CHAP domain containing protein n=1 Tax=Ktedonobacter racemifer DSM 44963 TaxID=485913 RepID=D6TT28_KTERA|nr:CHAP domain-containing protein [Ktedonobacter racemifer]EFH83579.1 CHAP domain containing protein [Ktedonobacter racemifer DSM 44963]
MLKVLLVSGSLFMVLMMFATSMTVTMDAQAQGPPLMMSPGTQTIDTSGTGRRTEVVQWALKMAAHLHCTPARLVTDCQGSGADHYYDAGFPPEIIQWANTRCPGCAAWQADTFQCVVFVIAAYAYVQPLPVQGQNANQYWEHFVSQPGWQRLPVHGNVPQPGDIMAWNGGAYGHVSIVLGVDPRHTAITFAQANGEFPVQTLPLNHDGSINTQNGYWNAFEVVGYLHPLILS